MSKRHRILKRRRDKWRKWSKAPIDSLLYAVEEAFLRCGLSESKLRECQLDPGYVEYRNQLIRQSINEQAKPNP